VDRAERRLSAQYNDKPLNLPPAAVVQVVTDIAALVRPLGGFDAS